MLSIIIFPYSDRNHERIAQHQSTLQQGASKEPPSTNVCLFNSYSYIIIHKSLEILAVLLWLLLIDVRKTFNHYITIVHP